MKSFEFDPGASSFVCIYSTTPLVVWGLLDCFGAMPLPSMIAEHVKQPCILFVNPMTSLESVELFQPDWLERVFRSCRDFNDAMTGNVVTILCGTLEELALVRRHGIKGEYVSQNSFVSDTIFHVTDNATKDFDAIYNAQYSAFKRHHLAEKIPKLALIYAIWDADRENKFAEMRARFPEAALLNGSMASVNGQPPTYRRLKPTDINRELSRARCGLCLSEAEGTMFASIEYLMAGLPVISTPNYGGRDKLFPPEFSIMTMPDATHVATAVRNLNRRTIDPYAVRSATIDLMRPHRHRYDEALRSTTRALGCDLDQIERRLSAQRRDLPHGFRDGSAGQLLQELKQGGGEQFFPKDAS